jgi:hypothetical protein
MPMGQSTKVLAMCHAGFSGDLADLSPGSVRMNDAILYL